MRASIVPVRLPSIPQVCLERVVISSWRGEAFNQVPDAANQIHGPEVARQYGFSGGLVPGVTIAAYLIHPAVKAWGLDWLTRGVAHVRVESPLYDKEEFDVAVTDSTDSSYQAKLRRSNGIISATADVSLPDEIESPPTRRSDAIAGPDFGPPLATPQLWAELRRDGCLGFRYQWPGQTVMRTYLRDETNMPNLLRLEGGGYANMAFILVCSNWILESNAQMNPWVHLETKSRNFRPIPAATSIVAEMSVEGSFEKKGHKFVDVTVVLYDDRDDACLTQIDLRAIYQLRGMSTADTPPTPSSADNNK